jgi:hypothetical protein
MADAVSETAQMLVRARDEQVKQTVALVDAMQARGPADALIAPLRDRLRRLRPARVPRFGRVLFTPVDPVIVASESWRCGAGTVPRTALAPIEAIVRRHLGAEATAIEAALSDVDDDAIARIEARLWPAAAAVMHAAAGSVAPADWAEAGLEESAFQPICLAIAAVLALATDIDSWAGSSCGTSALTGAHLRRAFIATRPAGAMACAMLGAVLLTRLPHASAAVLDAIASLAGESPALARSCSELAVNAVFGQIETSTSAQIGSAPIADATREVRTATLLLAGMREGAGWRRRMRLRASRGDLDAACRSRFADDLAHALMEPLAGSDAPALEARARDLRQFETAARELGGAAQYDALLRGAAERVRNLPETAPVTLADRVRLAEILAGSEEALRLFGLE